MKKIVYGLLFGMLLSGACAARVVLVSGEVLGAGDEVKGQDYFLSDHTCLNACLGGKFFYQDGSTTVAFLEGIGVHAAEEVLRGKKTVEEHCKEAIHTVPGRFFTTLYVPAKWSPDTVNRALAFGGRLLLREARKQTEESWLTGLAAGACIFASHSSDVGTQLAARSLLFKSAPALGNYKHLRSDVSLSSAPAGVALLGLQSERFGSQLCFMTPELVREVCGTQCYLRMHESGLFYLAHTWLSASYVINEAKRHGAERWWTEDEAVSLWIVRREDGVAPQAYWSTIVSLCAWLADTTRLNGLVKPGEMFSVWARIALAEAEAVAKSGVARLHVAEERKVSPPSPTDKESAKPGPPLPSLTLPPHVAEWSGVGAESPTGSPKDGPIGFGGYLPLAGGDDDKGKRDEDKKSSGRRWRWGRKKTPPAGDGPHAPLLGDDGCDDKK